MRSLVIGICMCIGCKESSKESLKYAVSSPVSIMVPSLPKTHPHKKPLFPLWQWPIFLGAIGGLGVCIYSVYMPEKPSDRFRRMILKCREIIEFEPLQEEPEDF